MLSTLLLALDGDLSNERTIAAGTNLGAVDGGANGAYTLNVDNNPTFTGLVTLNGNVTLESGDTITVAGDAIDEFAGTGLQVVGGDLQATLGTDIVTGEIADDTILAEDFDNTVAPGVSEDNYVLSYDDTSGGFTWVNPVGLGSASDIDITDGITTENLTDGNTLTFTDGTNIDLVVSANRHCYCVGC